MPDNTGHTLYRTTTGKNDAGSIPSVGAACTLNPYASSLDKSPEQLIIQKEDWIQNELPRLKARANNVSDTSLITEWGHARFFPLVPFANCSSLSCVGGECRQDRSKIVCGLQSLDEGCIVYSIGGNNEWEFELNLLETTPCQIHTFDCTGPKSRFQKPNHDRLYFHHVCLADKESPAASKCTGSSSICGQVMTLQGIQTKLGHDRIDLLKMDVEGFEWNIFESWPSLVQTSSSSKQAPLRLPMQLLVEFHYRTRFAAAVNLQDKRVFKTGRNYEFKFASDFVDLQHHMLQMGYAIVVRDDNQMCRHCTELTIVRFQC